MPITFKEDDIPDLWASDLPKDERERAGHLQSQLLDMATLTDEAASALALFDHSRQRVLFLEELLGTNPTDRISSPQKSEQELVSDWQFIAARAFVAAVWRLDEVRKSAAMLASNLPTIAPLIDRTAMKQAESTFGGLSQQHAHRRGALAHHDEPTTRDARSARRSPPIASPGAARCGWALDGPKVAYLREGEWLQLEVSQQTLARLLEVRNHCFAAFSRVGTVLQERNWQRTRRDGQQQLED